MIFSAVAAWAVSDEDQLSTISKLPGASDVEAIDEPGGGKRVRLTEPNGNTIEIVHGIEACSRSRSCVSRSTRVSRR
jgi:hypothetical protein